MKKKLLSLALASIIISTPMFKSFADTPSSEVQDSYNQKIVNGIAIEPIIEGSQEFNSRYTVATFQLKNMKVAIPHDYLVGDNYIREGKGVAILQEALRTCGFNPGITDGKWGTNTKNALINFQKSYSALTNDGICGPKTWEKLGQRCAGKTLNLVY
ncbi:MAG: peptidoglycan-binding domain-containing protein [Paraclostridium sp.]